jgi:hypothetical protein
MASTPVTSTDLDSTATTVAPMQQELQVSTFETKNHRNPPPASRHRAVFQLPQVIPLFDMQRSSQNPLNIGNLYQETRQSVPLMLVKAISTDIQRKLPDHPQFVELLIRFYPKMDEGTTNRPKIIEYYFIMPQTWAPRMYLGAVHLSINRHPVILIENVTIKGVNYLAINEVHWMFSDAAGPAERIRLSLEGSAAFIYINGGTI